MKRPRKRLHLSAQALRTLVVSGEATLTTGPTGVTTRCISIRNTLCSDGHRIMFCDMPDRQRLAYLKAGGLKRGPNGELSVAKGEN